MWTVFIIGILGLVLSEVYLDPVAFLLDNDSTYLSLIIVGISVTTAVTAIFTFKRYASKVPEIFWFISDALITLGMIGTLIGFFLVLTQALPMVDPNNIESSKEAISVIGVGMGTALLTTLSGITMSVWLKLQLVLMD